MEAESVSEEMHELCAQRQKYKYMQECRAFTLQYLEGTVFVKWC